MRSILVHLRDTAEDEVAAFLSRHYSLLPGHSWAILKDGKPVLTVDFYEDPEADFAEEAWRALAALLGGEPSVTVVADVSGQRDGEAHLREFAGALLGAFPGVAQDADSGYWWTGQEVMAGTPAQGHPLSGFHVLDNPG